MSEREKIAAKLQVLLTVKGASVPGLSRIYVDKEPTETRSVAVSEDGRATLLKLNAEGQTRRILLAEIKRVLTAEGEYLLNGTLVVPVQSKKTIEQKDYDDAVAKKTADLSRES